MGSVHGDSPRSRALQDVVRSIANRSGARRIWKAHATASHFKSARAKQRHSASQGGYRGSGGILHVLYSGGDPNAGELLSLTSVDLGPVLASKPALS